MIFLSGKMQLLQIRSNGNMVTVSSAEDIAPELPIRVSKSLGMS